MNIRHTRWRRGAPGLSQREPAVAGRVGGALYLAAGLFALLLLVLPGTDVTHRALLGPLGLAAVVYGLLCTTVIDWRRMPAWVLPVGTLAGLVCTVLAVYATDGFDSPMAIIPVFVVVYAACFFSSRLAVVAVASAVAAHELPLLYDAHARAQSVAASALSVTLVFGALAVVIVAGRTLLLALTDEHAAIRDLATAVAAGAPPADVCVLASRRIATLLGVDGCGILELTGAGRRSSSARGPTTSQAPRWSPGPCSRSSRAMTCTGSSARAAPSAWIATRRPSARRAWATAAR